MTTTILALITSAIFLHRGLRAIYIHQRIRARIQRSSFNDPRNPA